MSSIYFCLTGNKLVDSILLSSVGLESKVSTFVGKYKGKPTTTYYTTTYKIRNWKEFTELLTGTDQSSVLFECEGKVIECTFLTNYRPENLTAYTFRKWVEVSSKEAQQEPSYTYWDGSYHILGDL